jgi:molybdate transport system substrate-binding protein
MFDVLRLHYKELFILAFLGIPVYSASAGELNLAVANSTCRAIQQVGTLYEQRTDTKINYICKSSGRLAKGLNGETIDADVYISANRKWMNYMLKRDLIEPEKVTSPWGNELVVAVPANSQIKLKSWDNLAENDVQLILIGDPGTAPFGRYAKEALVHTGLWEKVRPKIETKKHITLLAEILAESDVHTVGILFQSNTTDKHKIAYRVDTSWHSPIRYYMAPLSKSKNKEEASAMLDFIQGPEAKQIFRNSGFKVEIQ